MKSLLVALALLQAVAPAPARIRNRTLPVDNLGTITYGISAPADVKASDPRPLVLALHPGGPRVAGYGSRFLQQVALPGLGDLGAVVVAPDCPAQSWTDPAAERAVLTLVERIRQEFAIDSRRVLVMGFSMGGQGTWFMSSRHADLFTAAIVMAGPTGSEPLERRGVIPTYIIHSRNDEVVPFAPAERTAKQLETMGRPVKFEELRGPSHGDMGRYVDALQHAGRWVADSWNRK
jgi:predicted peptidase